MQPLCCPTTYTATTLIISMSSCPFASTTRLRGPEAQLGLTGRCNQDVRMLAE